MNTKKPKETPEEFELWVQNKKAQIIDLETKRLDVLNEEYELGKDHCAPEETRSAIESLANKRYNIESEIRNLQGWLITANEENERKNRRGRPAGSVALTFKKTSLSRYDFLYYRWTDYACQCIKLVCK